MKEISGIEDEEMPAVEHVWLKTSSKDYPALVRADRIYDITCGGGDLMVCTGPDSHAYMTYKLVEGSSDYIPAPESVYDLLEAMAQAELSGHVCVISAEPLPAAGSNRQARTPVPVSWIVRDLTSLIRSDSV